jgi:hypothetical protein
MGRMTIPDIQNQQEGVPADAKFYFIAGTEHCSVQSFPTRWVGYDLSFYNSCQVTLCYDLTELKIFLPLTLNK